MLLNRQQIAALVLVVLLVVPGTAAANVRGSPDIEATVASNTVTAGEATTLQVTLTNEGDLDPGSATDPSLKQIRQVTTARGVDVTLEADGSPVEIRTGTQSIGRLRRGDMENIGYKIIVDENANPGTYQLEATLEYRYTSAIGGLNSQRDQDTETRQLEIPIVVDDRGRFKIIEPESNARVGATGSVTVTMENVGSEVAHDASVSLSSANAPLRIGSADSASRFAGDWQPGERRTLEYQLTATGQANPQRYPLTAGVNFEDTEGVARTSEPLSFAVTPLPEQRFTVESVNSSVAVGDTGLIAVTLRNAGGVAARDATVTLDSRSEAVRFENSSSTTRFVGSWAPGETRIVKFDATVGSDAEPRGYALQAMVRYTDADGDSTTAPPVSLGLTPGRERGFTLSNVSSTLRVGEEGTLRGTITNDGTMTARNVVVRFATESQQISPVTRTYSVGALEPGASATFKIDAEVTNAAASGPRQFAFITEYRDTEGEQRMSDKLLVRERVAPGGDVLAVEPVNATYTPGQTDKLTVRVTNTGNESLSSISAKLFADDPVSAELKEAFVGELEPGESTVVTLEASVSTGALATKYPVSLDFQYEDSEGDTHVSDSHQIAVDVTETKNNNSSGLPMVLIGVGAVGLVSIGGYLRYRD